MMTISRISRNVVQPGLSQRLLLYIAIIIILATLLMTAIQTVIFYNQSVARIHADMAFIAESYVPDIAIRVDTLDEKQLLIQLQGILNLRYFEYVEIVDTRGETEIITALGDPKRSRDIVREFPLEYQDSSGENRSFGTLKVVASLEGLVQRVIESIFLVSSTNLAQLVLVAFFFMLTLQRNLTRHLTTIADYSRKLKLEDDGEALVLERRETSPPRQDELDLLVVAINRMRQQLIDDIAERKQAEDLIKDSEKKLKEAQCLAKLGYYSLDIRADNWTSSTELNEIFGIDETFKRTSAGWLQIVHPDFVETMTNYLQNDILTQHQKFDKEYKIIDFTTGQEKWVHGLGNLTFDEENRPIEMFGTIQDITERKQAEAALRQSRHLLQMSFDTIREGIIVVDVDLNIVSCNQSAHRIFGYAPNELLGNNYTILLAQEMLVASDQRDKEATLFKKGYLEHEEFYFQRKNGQVFPATFSTALLTDEQGQYAGMVGTIMDITQDKQVEDALLESERRLSTLMNNLPGMAYRCLNDRSWTIQFVSRGCVELTGYEPVDLIEDKTFAYNNLIHPEDRDVVWEQVQQAVKDKQAFELTYRIIDKTGLEKWVWEQGVGVYSPDGEVIALEGFIADITKRTQAEEALRRGEEKYRTLFEHLPIPVFTKNRDGQYTSCNTENLRYWHVNPIGQTDAELLDPETATALRAVDLSVIESGDALSIEENLVNTPIGDRQVLTRKVPLRDSDGTVVGILGATIDITERKQAEATVKTERNLLRTIIDTIPDYIFIKDREGRFVTSNTAHAAAVGISEPHQLMGKTAHDFFPEELADHFHSDDVKVMEMNQPLINQERHTIDADGNQRWVLTTKVPLQDDQGKVSGLVGVSRDITERKQADEALRASEGKYRSLFERTTDAVLIIDLDFKYKEINQQAADMLGYTIDEIVNRPLTDFDAPDEHSDSSDRTKRLLAGEVLPMYERVLRRKDGTTFPAEVNANLVRDADGEPSFFHSVVRDITIRKQAEKERRAAAELRIELEKEKELRELKSQFISMVSHEYKNPLASILLSAETLERYYDRMDEEKKLKKYQAIRAQVNRMLELLEDVLMIGRVEAGRLDFHPAPLNLEEFCLRIITELQNTMQSQHQIDFQNNEGILEILADEKLMQLIFENLIGNAIKYSPEGSTISITTVCEAEQVIIKISDQGIGIPEESQKMLFQPFHRANNVGGIKGTGLGLPITKQAIEIHGGMIEVDSVVDEGTTFTVRLPLADTSGPARSLHS